MRFVTLAGRLLAMIVVGTVIGCAPGPVGSSATGSASPLAGASSPDRPASPAPSPTRSLVPSATAAAPPAAPGSAAVSPSVAPAQAFAADSIAVTVADRVLVRSTPGVGADSRQLTPLLPVGTRLFIVQGPVSASGYSWYLVQPLGSAGPFGWVAAGDRDGSPWVRTADISCPADPGLAEVATRDPLIALACYGGRSIRFSARLGGFDGLVCPDVAPFSWSVDPGWLDPCGVDGALTPLTGSPQDGYFLARFGPSVDRAKVPEYGDNGDVWTKVKVVGRYDHPSARSCRGRAIPDGVRPPPRASIVLTCRSEFVITSIKVVQP